MAQIAMIAGLGVICLSSSVGAALMMGGEEETPDTTTPTVVDPDRACPRNVTVVRTDNPVNWGMDLQFKCDDETIAVGNDSSGTATKTVGPYTVSKTACPAVIDKTNWLGGHTHPDTFDITVSECIDPGETCPRDVTVVRTDNPVNWGMDLQFKCDDETIAVGNDSSGTATKTVGPYNLNKTSCPVMVNKSNWLGGHTHPDTFDITVSECQ